MLLESNKSPIILFGNVRSGTSLIYGLFDLHPQIVGWYEPRLVWNYADPGRAIDRFTEKDATDKVKSYIRKRFKKYSLANGNLRIMEKTPVNILRIPYVNAIFPKSKFVYIVRDPFAQSSSSAYRWKANISWSHILRRIKECPPSQYQYYLHSFMKNKISKMFIKNMKKTSYGIRYEGIHEDLKNKTIEEVAAIQWLKACEYAEKDFMNIESSRLITVRYEDFVKSPIDVFSDISAHFGMDVTSVQKRALLEKVDISRQEKWRHIDDITLKKMEEIVAPFVEKHGYLLPSSRDKIVLTEKEIKNNIPTHWNKKDLN